MTLNRVARLRIRNRSTNHQMGPELPIHRQSIGPPTAHRFNFFAVWLDKGDVVGASVSGAGKRVSGYDPRLREVHGSVVDTSQWLAPASPLPQGGTAGTDHVADEAGWYAVAMQGDGGAYQLTIGVYRPALEGAGRQQTIFLDFDGATLDTSIFPFPGGVEPGPRALSPLRSFLAGWGLTDADESAVIDATIASVEENLLADVVARGGNPRYSSGSSAERLPSPAYRRSGSASTSMLATWRPKTAHSCC
ncbi:hypothetical protein [Phytohabitans flavus]|uniref:hypothetical protein n=1 Tax=Phytohabitans flavus TaxID=1076124 RepID=UPI00366C41C9